MGRTGPRERGSWRENFEPSIAGRSKDGAGVPAGSTDIFFSLSPKIVFSHFMASLACLVYWMILAVWRIFFARPVRGRVFRRESLTQVPGLADERAICLRAVRVRATRTETLVTVMEWLK